MLSSAAVAGVLTVTAPVASASTAFIESALSVKESTVADQPIKVTLEVSVAGGNVSATLTFKNVSTVPAFVDKLRGCLDGRIKVNVFAVTSGGKPVKFTLPMAKRRAPGPEDFLRLGPGESATTTVRLNEAYRFLLGSHNYVVRYEAFHDNPSGEELHQLISNEVSFVLAVHEQPAARWSAD
jgi:peptidyl-Lys metalloendopeptidase